MVFRSRIRLPEQWPCHVKSGILHAISLAGIVLACARGRATGRGQLLARLDQAETEIALLREELSIKDGRWERSRSRRRPHYTPTQRMRILQLRAARGWTFEKTARIFLLDLQTLLLWMRRLDEHGERELLQTAEPVNRYPDYVRNLVRQLKRLFPAMGYQRLAQFVARAGLALSVSTVRRIAVEPCEPPTRENKRNKPRRRAVARRPGDVWHVDLTAVPTRAGFWVPWFPFSLPQRWPFCWWVAVVVDQLSRNLIAFAVFHKLPSAEQVQSLLLSRAIRKQGFAPRCVVTDKGPQFKARMFRRWCKRREIRRCFGYLGEPCSIPIVERFILSMKRECLRRIAVPLTPGSVRGELGHFADWYNRHRPHSTLGGGTPQEAWVGKSRGPSRIETRLRWPHRSRHRLSGKRIALDVAYVAGRKHLPVIRLRRAA